jgi:hypothetical protein
MGLLSGWRARRAEKKDPSGRTFRRAAAARIAGQAIKYVTERRDGSDEVIGRHGSISVKNGELIVFASSDVLFRSAVDDTGFSELLSRDGVILKGRDLAHGGEERTVIVYFVYYLK